MIKYDRTKLRKMIREAYWDRYHKTPSQSVDRMIEAMDDAFMDEWRKEIKAMDEQIQAAAAEVQKNALETLSQLEDEVEALKENEIKDERVVDALKAYKTIVGMNFDTPQQKLQNIQNASYFIWALFIEGDSPRNMFFKDPITNVKEEDEIGGTRLERC